jgi:hypothetical protein
MVSQPGSGLAQGYDFSVRGGIAVEQIAIVSTPDDHSILHYDSAYRNLTGGEAEAGFGESLFHPGGIVVRHSAVSHGLGVGHCG